MRALKDLHSAPELPTIPSRGSDFKVIGVHTGTVEATVMNVPVSNLDACNLQRKTMGKNVPVLSASVGDAPVPIWVDLAGPIPTTVPVFGHARPEPFLQGLILAAERSIKGATREKALPMATTQTARLVRPVTPRHRTDTHQ